MNSVESSNKRREVKALAILTTLILGVLSFSACGKREEPSAPKDVAEASRTSNLAESQGVSEVVDSVEARQETVDMSELIMKVDGQEVPVVWEDNASVAALAKLAAQSRVTVAMSKYGGFEQVGALGASLPRADVHMTTQPGDVVLYSGNQIVLFYGSNSWSYTKLGRLGLSQKELRTLLGRGDVTVTLE